MRCQLVRNNGRILNIFSDCGYLYLSYLRNKYCIERLSKEKDVNEFVKWYLEASRTGTFKNEDVADNGTLAAYRVAKVTFSAAAIKHQKELEARNTSVNSMHPGLVKTDMTNRVGFFDADQVAETPLYLLLEVLQTLKGAYVWYDRKVVDWYDYKGDFYFKVSTLAA